MTVPEDEIPATDVVYTIVGGKVMSGHGGEVGAGRGDAAYFLSASRISRSSTTSSGVGGGAAAPARAGGPCSCS